MSAAFTIKPGIAIGLPAAARSILLAGRDVALDIGRALGEAAVLTHRDDAPIIATIEADAARPESWTIDVSADQIRIVGSDNLGLIYGLYELSRRFLDVDPLWFWKELDPPRRDRIAIPPQVIQSEAAAFRYRGWFVNDEDLLTGWLDGGFPRVLDYPFYQNVVHPDAIERVYEALLRCGGNMVIPASFLNILDPGEADLIERAVARGLYVSQHHIEPLGVSPFTYETYWRRQGLSEKKFEYGLDPQRVHDTWRIYAREWARIGGEQVIWQLGLRGRGDLPIWKTDPSVTEESAAQYINKALAEQYTIVREADPRPNPPATLTLWHEGSALMRKGLLNLPREVIAVFADQGASQAMQPDFHEVRRDPDRLHGLYYHVAFWSRGPHLAQGVSPERAFGTIGQVIDKGDTDYAIINVSNVRESVIGISAVMQQLRQGRCFSADRFWDEQVDERLAPLYQRYFAAIPLFKRMEHTPWMTVEHDMDHRTVSDGGAQQWIRKMIRVLNGTDDAFPDYLFIDGCDSTEASAAALAGAADAMDAIAAEAQTVIESLPPREQPFYTFNLQHQAMILRDLYRAAARIGEAPARPPAVGETAEIIAAMIPRLQASATGRWTHWYRGETKMNLPKLASELRDLSVKYDKPSFRSHS